MMATNRQLDDRIGGWLEAKAPRRLPDRVLQATFEQTRNTRQHSSWRVLLGKIGVGRTTYALGALAAVVVAVLGLGPYLGQPGGVGGRFSPTPGISPSASPHPTAPADGSLQPGTYAFHPLPAPEDELTVTFSVPLGWAALGESVLMPSGEPETGPPGGVAIQFIDITTINGDPCAWYGQDDDIAVGPAVDDLVEALRAQTAYEVADPIAVEIGGYRGKRVDIVMPTEPFPRDNASADACDDGRFRPWSTSAHGAMPIYVQGPANRWQANILDVSGTRLVIVVQDFPGTSAEDRAELDAIVESIGIQP